MKSKTSFSMLFQNTDDFPDRKTTLHSFFPPILSQAEELPTIQF